MPLAETQDNRTHGCLEGKKLKNGKDKILFVYECAYVFMYICMSRNTGTCTGTHVWSTDTYGHHLSGDSPFLFILEGPMSPIDLEPIKWARMPGPGALGTGLSLLPSSGPGTTHQPPSFSNIGSGD